IHFFHMLGELGGGRRGVESVEGDLTRRRRRRLVRLRLLRRRGRRRRRKRPLHVHHPPVDQLNASTFRIQQDLVRAAPGGRRGFAQPPQDVLARIAHADIGGQQRSPQGEEKKGKDDTETHATAVAWTCGRWASSQPRLPSKSSRRNAN